MNSVDETAREMAVLPGLKDKLMQAMNVYQSISMMRYYKNSGQGENQAAAEASPKAAEANNISESFTGQHTDIALIDANNGKIKLDDIENIGDETLRRNTLDSFENAAKDGYVELDKAENAYKLTHKGVEHINNSAFVEQFSRDRLNRVESQSLAHVKFRGNKNDLNVFRYAGSFNLNRLMASPQDLKRVTAYMQRCEDYGFVEISSGGAVTPTDKCRAYLSQTPDFDFEATRITADNAESIAGKHTAREGNNYARNEVGKQTANGTAKGAGKQTAQTAAKESGKRTAEAGAKTAAKAGGAAATAGTSAAAEAVVQLSKQGAKILEPDIRANMAKAKF